LSCAEQFRAMAFAQLTWRESLLRISANVTGDFGNVTDFGRMLGCAKEIVGLESI
jgi:hypothetical protein